MPTNYLEKYALTGSFLGSHYTWDNAHPLHGLILDEEDINDKSKVDSLLRALTVLQALWVILTAIVRGANGLPVSQLEIATSAFSLSAAATYAASWWKPKDVSRPLQLQEPTDWPLITPDSTYIIVQRFVLRLTSLFVAHHARFVTPPLRIPNDFVRMEGNIPLIFTLMACSSFVFGGIHLIAWNFEFPSYPELILWRVSSLTSSILPLITLGLNIYLNYRLTTHPTKHLIPWLSENLEPLEALRGPFWESLKSPVFLAWDTAEQAVLFSASPGQRDFGERPRTDRSQIARQELIDGIRNDGAIRVRWFTYYIETLDTILRPFREKPRDFRLIEKIQHKFSWVSSVHPSRLSLEFWDEYEDSQRKIHLQPGHPIPNPTAVRYSFELLERFEREDKRCREKQASYSRVCEFLVLGTGIIYVASRLIILVLLFTSLRSAPKGIYDNTPWTRFLPNIS